MNILSSQEKILDYLSNLFQSGQIYAIDGISGAGKTYFGDLLVTQCAAIHKSLQIIHLDWFIADRKTRNSRLQPYIETQTSYPDDFLDRKAYEALLKRIHEFFHSNQTSTTITIEHVYNAATEKRDLSWVLNLKADDIILCDGFLSVYKETRRFFAETILFVANEAQAKRNVLARESQKQPQYRCSIQEIELRRRWFDCPLEQRHLSLNYPYFTYLLDKRSSPKTLLIQAPTYQDIFLPRTSP